MEEPSFDTLAAAASPFTAHLGATVPLDLPDDARYAAVIGKALITIFALCLASLAAGVTIWVVGALV